MKSVCKATGIVIGDPCSRPTNCHGGLRAVFKYHVATVWFQSLGEVAYCTHLSASSKMCSPAVCCRGNLTQKESQKIAPQLKRDPSECFRLMFGGPNTENA